MSLGFLKYSIISSVNRDYLTCFVHVFISFTYFSCFIALAKNSSTKPSKSRRSGSPYPIPYLKEHCFSFFPFGMKLPIGLLDTAFLFWNIIPSLPSLLELLL
jgi:hypothetical protein